MKKTEKNDLRAKSTDVLKAEANALRDAMLKVRIVGGVQGSRQRGIKYRANRRDLARLETIISQKNAAAAAAK